MFKLTWWIAIAAALSVTVGARAQPDPWQTHSEHDRLEILAARQSARIEYQDYFTQAYTRFPRIPEGILEAIAYTRSSWIHLTPDDAREAHHGMPQAHGVMGLYGGGGFADHLGEAGELLDADRADIAADPRLNILGAAALLARGIDRHGTAVSSLEDMAPVLARFAGYGSWMTDAGMGANDHYPNASFAYVVLLALERGVARDGIAVPARAVAWDRAFEPEMLDALQAPLIRVGGRAGDIRLVNCPGGTTDYPDAALWCPADASNMTSGRGQTVRSITVHTMQGYYEGSIDWFQNPESNVSAHYMVRKEDGQVAQMVRDADTAWHVKGHNGYALGIEHEGFVDAGDEWYTELVYETSAHLTRWLCSAHDGVDCFRVYDGPSDFGCNNSDYVGEDVLIKGHQMYSGNSNRCDPGVHWDWGHYAGLVTGNDGGGGDPPGPDEPCL